MFQGKEEQLLDSKELKVHSNKTKSVFERKAWMWSMITQIIEGKDGISHHEIN